MEEEANLLLGRNPQGNFCCAADATHKLSEIFCDVFFFLRLSLSLRGGRLSIKGLDSAGLRESERPPSSEGLVSLSLSLPRGQSDDPSLSQV